jgi:hypothetical protein
MFVKSLKVSLLLTFTECKITTSSCWSWQASACLEKGWRNLATWMCWFEGWSPCSSDVLGMHYLWWSWEAWHGALSSWKMYPPFGNILAITSHTLSPRVSKYFVVFIFSSISVNVPTPSKEMHPQNITATRGPPLKPTHSGRQISSAFL